MFAELNSKCGAIKNLVKYDENKMPYTWGIMSDYDTFLAPWKNFKEGLYLAGFECPSDVVVPEGFTKWDVPTLTYFEVMLEETDVYKKVFNSMIYYNLPVARKN